MIIMIKQRDYIELFKISDVTIKQRVMVSI
jgi:hypothetical protein